MRNTLIIMLVAVVSLFAGAYLHKCLSPDADSPHGDMVDVKTYYDTVRHVEPVAVSVSPKGFVNVTVASPAIACHVADFDSLPEIRADTTGRICETATVDNPDSVTLQLPLTQKVYDDEDYKAYVSGVYPNLDSIFVYPRREVVTIKKPPKRWHIGPTIGFGVTPKGLQPYIGISVTYSLLSF